MLLAEATSAPVAHRPRRGRRRLGPGWPLAAVLCLYPLWWAVGIGAFSFVLAGIPMVLALRHRRPLRLPPAFGLWMLFLLWNVVSLAMLPFPAPGTITGSTSGRLISIVIGLMELASVTVLLLYVTNLSVEEVSQERLMKWMSVLFVTTVVGGVLGMVAPHLSFTSPFEAVLPHSISSNSYAASFVHPVTAQNQSVLSASATPRPAAPWGYTNFWGNNLSILLVWFCVYQRTRRPRRLTWLLAGVAVALVTIIYSLNRGVWFGLVLSGLYVVVRSATRGDMRALLATLAMIPVVAVAFFLSPLHSIVSQRASHGQSNDIRHFLDAAAYNGALESPVLGWGGTRKAAGSSQSIAIGPSPSCPLCGDISIGSTGQIWAVLFDQGLVGAAIYVWWFLATLWGLRRARGAVGAGARLIVMLGLFYTFFYSNLPSAMALTMISIGLSWRSGHRRYGYTG